MAWTVPRTWVTGEVVTAAYMNAQIRDNWAAAFPLGDPATWNAYTPSTSGWTPGSAAVGARYVQVGKLVVAQVDYVMAASSTFTGSMTVGLPMAALNITPSHVGSGYLYHAATGARHPALVELNTTSDVLLVDSGGSVVSNTVPWTWAANDALRFTVTYEAA